MMVTSMVDEIKEEVVYLGKVDDVDVVVHYCDNNTFCSSGGKKKKRNKEDKVWAEYDELLINAVKKRPCVWNPTITMKKKSSIIIKEAWLEIKKEIGDKFQVEIIRKRWRNLRDSYKKARHKMTECISSGSEAPIIKDKKDGFRYYDEMKFLNDTIISRLSRNKVLKDKSHAFDPSKTSSNSNNNSSNNNLNSNLNNKHSVKDEEDGNKNTPGINLSVSNCTNFLEHIKRPRNQSSNSELNKVSLNVLSEDNKVPDTIGAFLFQLNDILRKLPYKNRRRLETKIMMDALKAEEEAGLL
ncbi:uncharacterized protein DDB_G0288805-like [Odontomachus brunneus]|uniref:uncharacterized protein DDB_G0288805-like n=1 Tax=Odontomachus brunneus TaxID=486640 RepID=UPI0013F1A68C|nr:uncharacterized protein DDB_G0288805-like [Odontomachus brunneus]